MAVGGWVAREQHFLPAPQRHQVTWGHCLGVSLLDQFSLECMLVQDPRACRVKRGRREVVVVGIDHDPPTRPQGYLPI